MTHRRLPLLAAPALTLALLAAPPVALPEDISEQVIRAQISGVDVPLSYRCGEDRDDPAITECSTGREYRGFRLGEFQVPGERAGTFHLAWERYQFDADFRFRRAGSEWRLESASSGARLADGGWEALVPGAAGPDGRNAARLSGRLNATELELSTEEDGDGEKFARLTVELEIRVFAGTGIFGATGSQTEEHCRRVDSCVSRNSCTRRSPCVARFTHDFRGLTPDDLARPARRGLVAGAIAAGAAEEIGDATFRTRSGTPRQVLVLPPGGLLYPGDRRPLTGVAHPGSQCRAFIAATGSGRAAKARRLGRARANRRGIVRFRGRLIRQVRRAAGRSAGATGAAALLRLVCESEREAERQRPVRTRVSIANGPLERGGR